MPDLLAALIGADEADRARADLAELEQRLARTRGARYARRARRRELLGIVAWSLVTRARPRVTRARAPKSAGRAGVLLDVRYALRQLAAHRLFTVVAVLTLALGIAVNTAMFTVVHSVLLRPFPFEHGDRLVLLMRGSSTSAMLLVPDGRLIEEWRDASTVLEAIEVFSPVAELPVETAPDAGGSVVAPVAAVSAGYFAMLRLVPLLGRGFEPADERSGAVRVALIGRGFWQRVYGGRRDVIGAAVRVDGEAYEIVGVAPAEAEIPYGRLRDVDVWVPQRRGTAGAFASPGLLALGRLREGATRETAQLELAPVTQRLYAERDPDATWTAKVLGPEDLLGDRVERSLWILLGAVALVLLVACANVANLLLTRTLSRSSELAVRGALGASRYRLLRQLLVESAVLAMLGGVVGFALALVGLDVVVALRPDNLRELERVRIDGTVLAFALAITFLTTLLFGVGPALRASRVAVPALARGGFGVLRDSHRGRRFAASLVAAEIALSVVLMIGAVLLVRSMIGLLHRDTGFAHEGLLTATFDLPRDAYPRAGGEARRAFFEQLREGAAALPSVEAASLALTAPPDYGISFGALQIDGRTTVDPPEIRVNNFVGPEYFVLLGIEMRDGRAFDRTDMQASNVVIVAESFARRYFPDERAVGARIRFAEDEPWQTIIGVAADLPAQGLTDDHTTPQLHFPRHPDFAEEMLLVRTTSPATTLRDALAAIVARIDPRVPPPRVRTMPERLTGSLARERFTLLLLAAFATLALLLSAVGLYGVVAQTVGQRTREIGVRRALGARNASIIAMIVAQGMRPVAAGLLSGLLAAALLGRLMEGLLFGLEPRDPVTYITVPSILALTAALACLAPALRAASLSPTRALHPDH